MEKIAVIANNKKYARHLSENFRIFFSEYAEFYPYGTNEIGNMEVISEKYVILSAFTIFQQVKKKTSPESKLIIADLTLNKKTIERLYKIPRDTKALLVNIDYRNCMETITMIYEAGFNSLELIPFYPGCDCPDNIHVAITPGEEPLVPKSIKATINLEQRLIDRECIFKLAEFLNIANPFEMPEAEEAAKDIFTANTGIDRLLGEKDDLSERINVLLRLMRQGILITDIKGKIYLTNDMAQEILGNRTGIVTGFNITEVLPELGKIETQFVGRSRSGELININGVNVIANIDQIVSKGELRGNVITLEPFAEAEDRQHKLRSKMIGYGHKAVYRFEDIVGCSQSIIEIKKIAMRMATSDSSVCLYGESGTGKELFAQSIHNYSNRREFHFVAVNCSALPENLLESELYGYEEGAFSGAKRGGKIGLFELAHNGTLFLDEIGDLPLSSQAKLLRAIEERKIIKVGGRDLIDVNVRIICATNRNLLEMVSDKAFRQDLYYRLCVLPITIPGLRQRREDIPLIIDSIKSAMGVNFELTESASESMKNHRWDGNVRELKNVIEYISNLDKEIICKEDLPFSKDFLSGGEAIGEGLNPAERGRKNFSKDEIMQVRKFAYKEIRNLEVYKFILMELGSGQGGAVRLGRQHLSQAAKEAGIYITEQEIKTGLSRLNIAGFVLSGKGRKGTCITDKGMVLKDMIQEEGFEG